MFGIFAAALGHANPKVKEDTLTWLREEVVRELKPALSKLAPLLLPAAAKAAEEAAPSLREAAMGFMVAFAIKVRLGQSTVCISPYSSQTYFFTYSPEV